MFIYTFHLFLFCCFEIRSWSGSCISFDIETVSVRLKIYYHFESLLTVMIFDSSSWKIWKKKWRNIRSLGHFLDTHFLCKFLRDIFWKLSIFHQSYILSWLNSKRHYGSAFHKMLLCTINLSYHSFLVVFRRLSKLMTLLCSFKIYL